MGCLVDKSRIAKSMNKEYQEKGERGYYTPLK